MDYGKTDCTKYANTNTIDGYKKEPVKFRHAGACFHDLNY